MLYRTEERRDTHVFDFKFISTLREQDVYFGGSAKGNLVNYRYNLIFQLSYVFLSKGSDGTTLFSQGWLAYLSHSGDRLLWFGDRRRASAVVRLHLLLKNYCSNHNQIWYSGICRGSTQKIK